MMIAILQDKLIFWSNGFQSMRCSDSFQNSDRYTWFYIKSHIAPSSIFVCSVQLIENNHESRKLYLSQNSVRTQISVSVCDMRIFNSSHLDWFHRLLIFKCIKPMACLHLKVCGSMHVSILSRHWAYWQNAIRAMDGRLYNDYIFSSIICTWIRHET